VVAAFIFKKMNGTPMMAIVLRSDLRKLDQYLQYININSEPQQQMCPQLS